MKLYNWKNTWVPMAITTVLLTAIFVPMTLAIDSNTPKNVQFIMFGFSALIALLTYVGLIWRPSKKMNKRHNTDSTWKIEAKRDYPHLTLTFEEFKKIKAKTDWNITLVVISITIGQIIPLVITAVINW